MRAEGLRTRLQVEEALSPKTLAGPEERLLLESPQGLQQTVGEHPGILRNYPFPEGPIDTRSPLQRLADMYKEQQTSAVKGLSKTTPKGAYSNEGSVYRKSEAKESANALAKGLAERDRLLRSPIGKQKLNESLKKQSLRVDGKNLNVSTKDDGVNIFYDIKNADGESIGHLHAIRNDSKMGNTLFPKANKNGITIADIRVDKGYRKKGFATELVKRLERDFKNIEHSPDLTDAGKAFVKKIGEK